MGGITGSPVFETALAMVVIWLAAATLCSGITELIGSALGFRAKHLWEAISGLLSTAAPAPATGAKGALALGKSNLPAAGTPFADFVAALPGVTTATLQQVRSINSAAAAQALVITKGAQGFDSTQLGQLVSKLPDSIKTDADKLAAWMQRWFDAEMDRVSQAYRSRIRWWAALVALLVVVGGGVNSIDLATRFYQEPNERALVIAAAPNTTATTAPTAPSGVGGNTTTTAPPCSVAGKDKSETPQTQFGRNLNCVKADADKLFALKVSAWQHVPNSRWGMVLLALGLLLSWGAVAAGAPFWFAVLKRMMSLRGGGAADRSRSSS